MKIFISWSGEMSRELGEVLRNWLPSVLQILQPYFTPSDIEKGTRWSNFIAKELEESRIGIFCLTSENLNSPWLMFEAGAISKVVGKSFVCPILFDLKYDDVTGPLAQFQLTSFEKKDIGKLIGTINGTTGKYKLPYNTLESVFEMWWPKLEAQGNDIIQKYVIKAERQEKSEREELLKDVLSLTQMISKESQRREEIYSNEQNLEILKSLADLPPINNALRSIFEKRGSRFDKSTISQWIKEIK